jgi:hypothetical protein
MSFIPQRPRPQQTPFKPRPPQPPEVDLVKPLLGKRVVVVLAFGETWRGTLRQVSKFELEIELDGGAKLVLMKGAVGSIAEAKAAP